MTGKPSGDCVRFKMTLTPIAGEGTMYLTCTLFPRTLEWTEQTMGIVKSRRFRSHFPPLRKASQEQARIPCKGNSLFSN